jgi:hypothetical protein
MLLLLRRGLTPAAAKRQRKDNNELFCGYKREAKNRKTEKHSHAAT